MKAIIVAGGEGKRLRPLTEKIPKPMVQVLGKPILEHTINLLKKHGIRDIIIALCYLPETIVDYFGDGSKFGVAITYTYEDPSKPLGTAGAILPAKQYINDTCIVTYADILRDLDVSAMIQQHRQENTSVTLHTYRHAGINYKSKITFNDTTLLSFTEEATSKTLPDGEAVWSNGSFYIIEPEVLEELQPDIPTDFARDVFPSLIKKGKRLSVFPTSGYFLDIGTLETLKKAEEDLQKGLLL